MSNPSPLLKKTHSSSGTLYDRDLPSLNGRIDVAHHVALDRIRRVIWERRKSSRCRKEESIVVHTEQ